MTDRTFTRVDNGWIVDFAEDDAREPKVFQDPPVPNQVHTEPGDGPEDISLARALIEEFDIYLSAAVTDALKEQAGVSVPWRDKMARDPSKVDWVAVRRKAQRLEEVTAHVMPDNAGQAMAAALALLAEISAVLFDTEKTAG